MRVCATLRTASAAAGDERIAFHQCYQSADHFCFNSFRVGIAAGIGDNNYAIIIEAQRCEPQVQPLATSTRRLAKASNLVNMIAYLLLHLITLWETAR